MKEDKFEYTYSAFSEEEMREAEYIRSRYVEKDKQVTKFEELKKLGELSWQQFKALASA